MPQYKVIQGPVQGEGKTYEDGEIFESTEKAIAPLIKAAVVVEATSFQEPLSTKTGGTIAPQSPTEVLEEEETLPESLIKEKNETLERIDVAPQHIELLPGEVQLTPELKTRRPKPSL